MVAEGKGFRVFLGVNVGKAGHQHRDQQHRCQQGDESQDPFRADGNLFLPRLRRLLFRDGLRQNRFFRGGDFFGNGLRGFRFLGGKGLLRDGLGFLHGGIFNDIVEGFHCPASFYSVLSTQYIIFSAVRQGGFSGKGRLMKS